jgi:hypothetical protein
MQCGGKVDFQSGVSLISRSESSCLSAEATMGMRLAWAKSVSALTAGMISSLPPTYSFPSDFMKS